MNGDCGQQNQECRVIVTMSLKVYVEKAVESLCCANYLLSGAQKIKETRMDFDGEQIEDLSNAEIIARIQSLWSLCERRMNGDEYASGEIYTDDIEALIDELAGREI